MNTKCPYHQQQPPCILIDVVDTQGGEERVHTHAISNSYLVWTPPLQTNAVTYGDRIIAQPHADHLVPTMVVPGQYVGAFGRIRHKAKALRALSELAKTGYVCAWDDKHFGVAFPQNAPLLGDKLLELHARGPLDLDQRYIDRLVNLVTSTRHPNVG
jgi:hypothetical protein